MVFSLLYTLILSLLSVLLLESMLETRGRGVEILIVASQIKGSSRVAVSGASDRSAPSTLLLVRPTCSSLDSILWHVEKHSIHFKRR